MRCTRPSAPNWRSLAISCDMLSALPGFRAFEAAGLCASLDGSVVVSVTQRRVRGAGHWLMTRQKQTSRRLAAASPEAHARQALLLKRWRVLQTPTGSIAQTREECQGLDGL